MTNSTSKTVAVAGVSIEGTGLGLCVVLKCRAREIK